MALRNLAAKMRIPATAAAAARLPSVRRVSAPFSSFSPEAAARKSATEWYLFQRERYEEGTRRLARYRLGLPVAIGATGVRATGFQPTPV